MNGDATSGLEEVYDAHVGWMYRHALMVLCDHAAAEDVVQQVFVKLARVNLGLVGDVPAYLRRVVRGECFRLLKREQRQRELAMARPLLEAVQPVSPEEKEQGQQLEQALWRLPVEQREVMYLKVYEDLTFAQIGEVVGVSMNTAASRYRYAIQKLQSLLAEVNA
jgi:RNA polymerase sigma-70 factor (ECF subfamily)